MLDFFKWLLGIKNQYLVTVSYSKHGGNYYPKGPKSNNHAGTAVSNQFFQSIVVVRNTDKIIGDINAMIKQKHPKASNFMIESCVKI